MLRPEILPASVFLPPDETEAGLGFGSCLTRYSVLKEFRVRNRLLGSLPLIPVEPHQVGSHCCKQAITNYESGASTWAGFCWL
jgi:hypothetical protein